MADVKAVCVRVKSAMGDAGTVLFRPKRDDEPISSRPMAP